MRLSLPTRVLTAPTVPSLRGIQEADGACWVMWQHGDVMWQHGDERGYASDDAGTDDELLEQFLGLARDGRDLADRVLAFVLNHGVIGRCDVHGPGCALERYEPHGTRVQTYRELARAAAAVVGLVVWSREKPAQPTVAISRVGLLKPGEALTLALSVAPDDGFLGFVLDVVDRIVIEDVVARWLRAGGVTPAIASTSGGFEVGIDTGHALGRVAWQLALVASGEGRALCAVCTMPFTPQRANQATCCVDHQAKRERRRIRLAVEASRAKAKANKPIDKPRRKTPPNVRGPRSGR